MGKILDWLQGKPVAQDPAEAARRNTYWFGHWQEFSCPVVVQQDKPGPRLGLSYHASQNMRLYGSEGTRMIGATDSGTFQISPDGTVRVQGRNRTWAWSLWDTQFVLYDNGPGLEVRQDNKPVIYVRGPVQAAVLGAVKALGIPNWDNVLASFGVPR
jgi:hypothetical protein